VSRGTRTVAFGLLLALSWPLSAHRGQDALTVVEIDDARGEVIATHHFAAHDIEPLLPRLAPDVEPSIDDPAAQDALTAHLARRFVLSTDGGDIALTLDALRLHGDDVRAVFRGRFPRAATAIDVRSTLGADLTAGSSHQINVRRLGVTRTLVFEGADDAGSVPFGRTTGGGTE
jgi:hypothetical protein